MSFEFQASQETSAKPAAPSADDIIETCLVRTADALSQSDAASDEEIAKALKIARDAQKQLKPVDLIETLARVLGYDEEHIAGPIAELSNKVASTMQPSPPVIPFASKLIAPSSFYESFDAMHKLGKSLLVPVVFAEDTDAIGTGSINPIAASILGEEIYRVVGKRFDIRPFITVVRMDYESWAFVCRKHFEL